MQFKYYVFFYQISLIVNREFLDEFSVYDRHVTSFNGNLQSQNKGLKSPDLKIQGPKLEIDKIKGNIFAINPKF